jgi:hypothetical protein
MNYSDCTLHVFGKKEAIDKHQDRIVEWLLRHLNKLPRYEERCRQHFSKSREGAEYLTVMFRTMEGSVDEICPPPSDVLTTTDTQASEDELVILLTWANESSHYTERYAKIGVSRGCDVGHYHLPAISQEQFVRAVKEFARALAAPIST